MEEDKKEAPKKEKSVLKYLKSKSINLLKPKQIVLGVLIISLFLTVYSVKQRQNMRQNATEAIFWQPAPLTDWQWQMTGQVDTSVNAPVFVIDLFDNEASVVSDLHSKNRKVVCSMSVGTVESRRPDAGNFPAGVIGNTVPDKQDERYLDIRNIAALSSVIDARLDLCKQKGFDAAVFANDDTYANNTGFYLKAHDQITYNSWLAGEAHKRGLSAGLRNDLSQVSDLVGDFDFALTEECFKNHNCNSAAPFSDANKAVFNAEYDIDIADSDICFQTYELNISTIKKNKILDAYRDSCFTDENITITGENPVSITVTPSISVKLTPTITFTPTLTAIPTILPTLITSVTPTINPFTTIGASPTPKISITLTVPTIQITPYDKIGTGNNLIDLILRLINDLIKMLMSLLGNIFNTNPTGITVTPPITSIPTPPLTILPTLSVNVTPSINPTPTITPTLTPTPTEIPTPPPASSPTPSMTVTPTGQLSTIPTIVISLTPASSITLAVPTIQITPFNNGGTGNLIDLILQLINQLLDMLRKLLGVS